MRFSPYLAAILSAAVLLAGCSTKNHSRGNSAHYGSKGSESYPMYSGQGYRGNVVRGNNGKIVNSLSPGSDQTYYFAFDKAGVDGQDLEAIQRQAQYLVSHPKAEVRLEGNTDDVGSREYNIALGNHRSQSVEHLLEQYGVKRSQLHLVSYGKERPASLGTSDDDRALNRRVHMVYEVK